ncbi:uncharacterized protein [Palaemon carinicauda]|uniref:uncharacterized protein n=1 Tax=Palaemon carinicauda TaxID=392227 RepID=UPI0035B6A24B
METAASASCTSALLSGYIARFDIPENNTSDRGTASTSQLWTSLANLLGITIHQTTAYSPAENGMVERFHCQAARTPTGLLSFPGSSWDEGPLPKKPWTSQPLKWCMATRPCRFFSSVTSSDNLQHIRHVVGKFTPCLQTSKPQAKHHIPADLNFAMHVFLHNDTRKPPLSPHYTGPFLVIRRNPKAFLLNIRGKEDCIYIDRLKPAYLLTNDLPTVRLSRQMFPPLLAAGHIFAKRQDCNTAAVLLLPFYSTQEGKRNQCALCSEVLCIYFSKAQQVKETLENEASQFNKQ